MFNESNMYVDESGQIYYIMENGIKITFGEYVDGAESEENTEDVIEENTEGIE